MQDWATSMFDRYGWPRRLPNRRFWGSPSFRRCGVELVSSFAFELTT